MSKLSDHIESQSDQWMRASPTDGAPVATLADYVGLITRFFRGGGWLYRGEGELFSEPLTPTVFRSAKPQQDRRAPALQITDEEISAVEDCQQDYKLGLVRDRFMEAFLPSISPKDVNWLPLARHFGYDTRLLDVTMNPLVALYFACDNPSVVTDAYVYVFQGASFRPVSQAHPPKRRPDDYPPTPADFLSLYDVDVPEVGDKYDRLPYRYDASIPQERILAQAGVFLFWRERGPILDQVSQMIPIRIDGNEKQNLLGELTALGVSQETLFPR